MHTLAMQPQELTYRSFTADDLAGGLALSQSLGWSHRDVDWSLMAAVGQGIAVDAGDRLVGTGFLWCFGDRCTLGMMLVAPDMQRRGIGRTVMRGLLDMAGTRPVTLIATQQGEPLYGQLGFRPVGGNWLYMGDANREAIALPTSVEEGQPRQLDEIVRLDQRAIGTDRSTLLRELEAVGTRYEIRRHGRPVGFAYLRPSGLGYTIGPVVAPDWQGARDLIAYCALQVDGVLRIDLAAEDDATGNWLTSIGMPLKSRSPKMRLGTIAAAADDGVRLFALTNQAIG